MNNRNEMGADCTIFTGSTVAISRAASDRRGPRQTFAKAVITLREWVIERGYSITMRWTPANKGVEDNEVADEYAKAAAESACYSVDRQYLQEASLAHLTRETTEKRSRVTRNWISQHVKRE